MGYTWTDHLELGKEMIKLFPDDDPWTMPFPEMKQKVLTVPNFEGTADDEVEDYEFEGIQSAWGWSKE